MGNQQFSNGRVDSQETVAIIDWRIRNLRNSIFILGGAFDIVVGKRSSGQICLNIMFETCCFISDTVIFVSPEEQDPTHRDQAQLFKILIQRCAHNPPQCNFFVHLAGEYFDLQYFQSAESKSASKTNSFAAYFLDV